MGPKDARSNKTTLSTTGALFGDNDNVIVEHGAIALSRPGTVTDVASQRRSSGNYAASRSGAGGQFH